MSFLTAGHRASAAVGGGGEEKRQNAEPAWPERTRYSARAPGRGSVSERGAETVQVRRRVPELNGRSRRRKLDDRSL